MHPQCKMRLGITERVRNLPIFLGVYRTDGTSVPYGNNGHCENVSGMPQWEPDFQKCIDLQDFFRWHAACSWVGMSREQGASQAVAASTVSDAVAATSSDFVDGRIYRDVEEMRQINAAAAAKGYLLVCDRCKNLSEPIVAVIAVANTDDAFGFCGDCYRKISEDFLGHIV